MLDVTKMKKKKLIDMLIVQLSYYILESDDFFAKFVYSTTE